MQVGFIGSVIESSGSGLGIYASNLLDQYYKMGKTNEVTPIHFEEHPSMARFPNDRIATLKPRIINKVCGTYVAIQISKPDLVHFPVYRVDDFVAIRMPSTVKKILTVHDITPILPQFPEENKRQKLWAKTIKYAIPAIDYFIADSDSTKRDCITILGIPEEKIQVIPLAANENITPTSDRGASNNLLKNTFKKIKHPFIMATGTIIPRKNYGGLIEAFADFKKTKGVPYQLVIVGERTPYCEILQQKVKELSLENDVVFTGYVNILGLNLLYNTASLFVYPSIYEGFGIPPLEAMKCGTPVVAANTSSIPEVTGDAAKLFEINNKKALSDAMYKVISDEDYWNELSKKGKIRANQFSWAKTASETWNVYNKVVSCQ